VNKKYLNFKFVRIKVAHPLVCCPMTELIEKRKKNKQSCFPVISETQVSNQTARDRDLLDDTNDTKYECN
jgi:isochorismate hydrolase